MREIDSPSRLSRQLPLDLRPRTHGGARAGAGRPRKKESERTAMAHRKRPSHRKDDPVHVTIRLKDRGPSLRSQLLARIVERALRDQRAKLSAKGAKHFQVVHFSIQSDHVHLIVEAPDKRGLWRGMTGLEVRLSQRLNEALGKSGRLWAERYHRHDLRTPSETRNALRYVLMNARKHERATAAADEHSSAATFDGFARPATIANAAQWPRVDPRTWLLRIGWRRRGLIDPTDAPWSTRRASH